VEGLGRGVDSMKNKSEMKIAVYAGSFDPLTVGHLWMIEKGASLFEKLVVAIGINPDKRYTFSMEDRLAMLRQSTSKIKNLEIASFSDQFLINYARKVEASFILRGIRSESDYEYERGMRNINGDLSPDITTIFLMPPRDIAEISSSMVKGLVGPQGWETIVRDYVPKPVYTRLLKTFHARRTPKQVA
jgi:pantetheine-phosphate adenylyltransferase